MLLDIIVSNSDDSSSSNNIQNNNNNSGGAAAREARSFQRPELVERSSIPREPRHT